MKIIIASIALLWTSLTFAQVTSVAGRTGDVFLNVSDIAGLGEYLGNLPAPEALGNANATMLQWHPVSMAPPTQGQTLVWESSQNMWVPGTCGDADARIEKLEARVRELERKRKR